MIRNYLKIAYRNLVRHKIYSFINISGLAIGIAFCILTFLYVRNEWTHDAFHENADRIYRVYAESSKAGIVPAVRRVLEEVEGGWADGTFFRRVEMPIALGPALAEAFPDISAYVRLSQQRMHEASERVTRVTYKGVSFDEKILLADPAFFDVFSFPLKFGDAQTALRKKNSVVISQEIARKYFGDDNPLGKQLAIRSFWSSKLVEDFTVTGIVEDFLQNSSIQFHVLLPFDNYHFFFHLDDENRWRWFANEHTYVLISETSSVSDLEERLTAFVQTKPPPFWTQQPIKLRLQPLTDLHFNRTHVHASFYHGIELPSDPVYSYVLSSISLLVLLIACINFVNLSLGRAATRVKEVGIRKVVGANRLHLIKQFCGEAILLSFIALGFGLALVEFFLPVFNSLTSKALTLTHDLDVWTFVAVVVLALFVGLVTGSYPALVLSSFHPVEVFKQRVGMRGRSIFSRGLVVIQFALAIFFIVCTLVMVQQLNYVKSRDLGFKDDFLLAVYADELPEIGSYHHALKARFWEHPKVTDVTMVRDPLIEERGWRGKPVQVSEDQNLDAYTYFVDPDFVPTLDMEVLEGEDFSRRDIRGGILVNEAFVRAAGWEEPLGKTVKFDKRKARLMKKSGGVGTVIGVVKNFHFQSLHHRVKPEILALNPMIPGKVDAHLFLLRIRTENLQSTLQDLEAIWYAHSPHYTFRYTFFDEDLAHFYRDETRWSQIIRYATWFTIFIACLGAFGLTALAVARRTKEIGIRKVLGASVPSIVSLFIREFILLVAVATVIAWPVAYYAMDRWLQDFAYRIDPGVGTFVLGGVLTLAIVLLTVGSQAMRAARANPVDALRYE